MFLHNSVYEYISSIVYGAHHRLADVPLGPLIDLHPELVLPRVQVALQPEISIQPEV